MTLENICLPTLGMLKLLTRIEMSIPGWSLPARTSKDTFGFQPNILWALLLSPCRCSCCWNKKEITQERKRQKNKQSGFRLCVTISLSLSLSPPLPLSGRRQRSEILAVINPLSWLFNHAFVQTSLFVPDGPGHDELWDSCGTTFPTSSEASPPPPFPCWVLPRVRHPAQAWVRPRRQKQTLASTDAFLAWAHISGPPQRGLIEYIYGNEMDAQKSFCQLQLDVLSSNLDAFLCPHAV